MLERMTTDEVDIVEMVHLIATHNDWTHQITETPTVVINMNDHVGEYIVNAFDTDYIFHVFLTREYEFNPARELEIRRLIDAVNNTTGSAYFQLHEEGKHLMYRTAIDFTDDRPLSNDWVEDIIKTMSSFFSLASEAFYSIAGVRIDENQSVKNGIVCLDSPVTVSEAVDMIFKHKAGYA